MSAQHRGVPRAVLGGQGGFGVRASAWRGGDASNTGYGSKLDTIVTWTLEPVADAYTVMPRSFPRMEPLLTMDAAECNWMPPLLLKVPLLTMFARLAVLLPSPRKRDPRQLTPYLAQRVSWVKQQMRQLGPGHLQPVLN